MDGATLPTEPASSFRVSRETPNCLGPTAADRLPSSAPGRADEDHNEVADEMSEDEDEELRWKDSGDMSRAVKTP